MPGQLNFFSHGYFFLFYPHVFHLLWLEVGVFDGVLSIGFGAIWVVWGNDPENKNGAPPSPATNCYFLLHAMKEPIISAILGNT